MSKAAWVWLGIGAVIFVGALARNANNGGRAAAPAPEPPAQQEQLERLDATAIWTLYEGNEVRADEILKGKRLIVVGTAEKVGKDVLDTPYVKLAGGSPVFGVQAMFARNDTSLGRIVPGQEVAAACTVSGKMGNVLLKDCELR